MKSADTAGGWKNHYRRMRRWEERSLRLLNDLPATDFHDAIDMSLAYFLWSHSLREWLIQDGTVEAPKLDAELANHPVWKLCRDVANRTRHLKLTRNPTDQYWSVLREMDPFAIQLDGRERHIAIFIFDGIRYRISDSIFQSSTMWAEVTRKFQLSPQPDNLAI